MNAKQEKENPTYDICLNRIFMASVNAVNSDFIVKAVNSHDDLVRSLKIVLARIESERKEKGENAVFMLNAQYESFKEALKKAGAI